MLASMIVRKSWFLLDQCLQLNNLEQLPKYCDGLYLDYLHCLLMLEHLLIRDVDDGYPVNLHENAKNRQNAQDEVVRLGGRLSK
ncbi:hypothetical protein D9M71_779350 [compost metagenome]